MSVSPAYHAFVLERLAAVTPVRPKSFFGELALYAGDLLLA